MTDFDIEKMVDVEFEINTVKHLKKALRTTHMALSVANRCDFGVSVTDPLREAIRQLHISIDVVQGKL